MKKLRTSALHDSPYPACGTGSCLEFQRDIILSSKFDVKNLNGTHEDERTVLYKTKSLDGTKPNTNPKTNPNPNTDPNPDPKLTQILNLFSCFILFFEHRPLIFSLANINNDRL